MTGRIPERFIDELLTRIDIVDVIQERVTLRIAVDTGAEVAEKLTALVRELRKYQKQPEK